MALVKSLLFILMVIFLLTYLFFKYDGYLGDGDYFLYFSGYDVIKSKKSDLYLSDIRAVEYNNNYIIALRIPQKHYSCKNGNIITITDTRIQYVLIEKKTNKVYATFDKSKFTKMKKELKINLVITENHEYRVKKRLQSSIYNNMNDKISEVKNCKEIYSYPIMGK